MAMKTPYYQTYDVAALEVTRAALAAKYPHLNFIAVADPVLTGAWRIAAHLRTHGGLRGFVMINTKDELAVKT